MPAATTKAITAPPVPPIRKPTPMKMAVSAARSMPVRSVFMGLPRSNSVSPSSGVCREASGKVQGSEACSKAPAPGFALPRLLCRAPAPYLLSHESRFMYCFYGKKEASDGRMARALRNAVPSPERAAVVTKAVLRAAERLGLTNKVLASVIGLSEATVSRMRSGELSAPGGPEAVRTGGALGAALPLARCDRRRRRCRCRAHG